MIQTATLYTASALTNTSAVLSGSIGLSSGSINSYNFDYGLTTAYGSQTPSGSFDGSGSAGQAYQVSAQLSGLTNSTLYHFRLYTTSVSGSVVSSDGEFTTPWTDKPVVNLGAVLASSLTTTGGTVTGSIQPSGSALAYNFDFGLTTAYGSQSTSGSITGSVLTNVSEPLTLLSQYTTYHYRLYVTNVSGSVLSVDGTFLTEPATASNLTGLNLMTTPNTQVTTADMIAIIDILNAKMHSSISTDVLFVANGTHTQNLVYPQMLALIDAVNAAGSLSLTYDQVLNEGSGGNSYYITRDDVLRFLALVDSLVP